MTLKGPYGENLCGKPVTSFPRGSRRAEARLTLPDAPGFEVTASTVCLLEPGHEGDCKDAIAKLVYQGRGEGDA